MNDKINTNTVSFNEVYDELNLRFETKNCLSLIVNSFIARYKVAKWKYLM